MISKTKLIDAFSCILFFVYYPGGLVILIQVDIQNQIDWCFSLYFVFRLLSMLISHFNSTWYPKPNWFILALIFCFAFFVLGDYSFEFKLISKTKLIYSFACILFFVCSPCWLVIWIQVHIQKEIDLFFCSYFVFRFLSWLISHFNSSWYPKQNWFILGLVFCFAFFVLGDYSF